MRTTRQQIESEAKILGVDLSAPYAERYIRARLESSGKKGGREPTDASGFTDDVEIIVIREA